MTVGLPIRRILLCTLLLLPAPGGAAAEPLWYSTGEDGEVVINVHFFWSVLCPHCHRAQPFIERLAQKTPWLRLHSYELVNNRDNAVRYLALARQVGEEARSVPAFIFCGQMVVGFDTEQGIGAFLSEQLRACHQRLLAQQALTPPGAAQTPLSLPLFGAVDAAALSLPTLTLVIAGVDAFNPCAFFVLLFLLSLLVHARSRTRMLLVGSVFVLCSGVVYFVFMAAWLNLFMLIGELQALTLVAGLLAVAVAAINIKDYFWFKAGISLTLPEAAKPGLFARVRRLINAENLAAMLAGTVVLALVANSYELLCTAGFPMVYTRILTLNELAGPVYYFYLVAYNVIYIIPLAVIVAVFTWTLGARRLSEREGRVLKLLSGLMMLGLGLLLVFVPQWLNNVLAALGLLIAALAITGLIVTLERLFRSTTDAPE